MADWRKRKGSRGMVLPMVVLFLAALLVISALAIDVGVLYTARTSMQHAADAAALAGAFSFNNPTNNQPDAAIAAAISVAPKTSVLGEPVVLSASDVNVDTTNRRVTVFVDRQGPGGITTFFARAMGRSLVDVHVRATAEASTYAAGDYCIRPFFIPNTVLSDSDPATACKSGQVLFTPSGELSTFANSKWGTEINLRPITPKDSLGPSQFYSLQLGGPGASTYQCAIEQCLNTCPTAITSVRCGVDYPLETGNMAGPTTKGITDFIGKDPDQWTGAVGEYLHPDGTKSDTSKSVMAVPVWDNCVQTIDSGTNGQKPTVVGFMQVFVEGLSNGGKAVKAHLVNAAGCSITGGSGEASTGPYAIPVRLIQTPSN